MPGPARCAGRAADRWASSSASAGATSIVAEQLLGPKQKGEFTIGTAAGVDFIMGDQRLGAPSFALVTADGAGGFTLRFTGR